jgi:hypothetical protein
MPAPTQFSVEMIEVKGIQFSVLCKRYGQHHSNSTGECK